ncbi:MAG: GGDEF domain-containing protein, partial [Nannocystaceae bacterium]
KQINDTEGHVAGDQILSRIGKLTLGVVNSSETGFRYGGDEFAALLPGVTGEQAVHFARRIQARLAAAPARVGGRSIPITVSLGLGEYVKGDTPTSLLDRADRALYRAKEAGKNRLDCQVA